jgi:hypothetical protein
MDGPSGGGPSLGRTINVRIQTRCAECRHPLLVGELAVWNPMEKHLWHRACAEQLVAQRRRRSERESERSAPVEPARTQRLPSRGEPSDWRRRDQARRLDAWHAMHP